MKSQTTKGGKRNPPKHIPHNSLHYVPTDKNVNVLVADVAERNGPAELVDEADGVDDDAGGGQALGARGGLEGLRGDDGLQRGVGEGEDDVEEEVGGERALGVGALDAAAVLLCVEGGGEAGVAGERSGAGWWSAVSGQRGKLKRHGRTGGERDALSVPITRTLRRGMRSVRVTAARAPTAESTELSRL